MIKASTQTHLPEDNDKIIQLLIATELKSSFDKAVFALGTVSSVAKHVAIGTGGLGFDSRNGQIRQCRQRLAAAATFLRSCVAQTQSHGDGPRHSLRRNTASTMTI